ncbi:MAG: DUF1673 family protein, partial [Methanomicrobiales archaeon]|nr:DUF1673 family protein [Methanomicrobiales archaeon]
LHAIIRKYLGWCPHAAAYPPRSRRLEQTTGPSMVAADPSSGAAGHGPGDFLYEHTQIGTIQVWASVGAIVIITLSILMVGMYWFSLAAILFLGAAILLFGSLTVRVTRNKLQIRFGPFGIVSRHVPLTAIRSVVVVKTPWYYGWGIRWTPEGTLYNMAGEDGIEITLENGTRFRVGTDEPALLAQTISTLLTRS